MAFELGFSGKRILAGHQEAAQAFKIKGPCGCYSISPPPRSDISPAIASLHQPAALKGQNHHYPAGKEDPGETPEQCKRVRRGDYQKVRTLNDQRLTAAARGNLPVRRF